MFFTSFVKVYDGDGLPSLGLTPASSPLDLVSSSPFPLSVNIACTASFPATVAIWAVVSCMHSWLIAIFIYFAYVRLPFLVNYLLLRLPRMSLSHVLQNFAETA